MNAKIFVATIMLGLAFQNCGGMKAELFARLEPDCPDCGQACDASESLEIQSEINGTNLSLDLVVADSSGLLQNAPAQWSVQDQTGRIITQSRTESTESFFVDLRTVSGCKIIVSAQSSANTCNQNLQKQIQIGTCGGNEIITTTTQRQNPYVTTTTLPRQTTTTTVPIVRGPGPEIVSGCQAQYPVTEVLYPGLYGFWPSYGKYRRLSVPNGTTLSIEFTTHASASVLNPVSDPGYGSMIAMDEIPGAGDGHVLMTISTTKGCVDRSKLDPRCYSVRSGASVGWSETSTAGVSCPLQFNQKYYFNFTFGTRNSAGAANEPFCVTGNCQRDFIQQIQ